MAEKFELYERLRIAYKKLKASVYFDKTQLPLRDNIVKFEASGVDEKLTEIYNRISGEGKAWEAFEDDILNSIGVLVFPKKLCDWNDNESTIIFNTDNEPVRLEKAQHFIDLPVAGHILGVLWVLSIGLMLDNRKDPDNMNMYEHSYGKRLRKTLINPETGDITYSPNLFEPYFEQYESWRDRALEYAKKRLDDKQDALILTLDFKSFFYSVDIQEQTYNELLKNLDNYEEWHERVHTFVYKVLSIYSKILREINTDEEMQIRGRTILPIGFLPSNILSNWVLTPFDDAIIKRWNPVYYGRYVDDIIIVDKVEKNSPLHKRALGTSNGDMKLTTRHVIEYYFCSCANDRVAPTSCTNGRELFKAVSDDEKTASQKDKNLYRINPEILSGEKPDIQIQNDKVKVFYFHEGATRALLDCFRTQIAQNASEFRYLPEMDTVLKKNDYSEIFCLNSDDSIHKLRGVTGVVLDKFSLSKFLGKYRKVGCMIRDKRENAFDKDLLTILDKRALIENFTLWERLLEIMIVNDRLANYEKLIVNILDAIIKFKIPEDKVKIPEDKAKAGTSKWNPNEALLRTFHAAICRTAALRWGEFMDKAIGRIGDVVAKKLGELTIDSTVIESFSREHILKYRKDYCLTRMVNKYVMPILIDCIKQDVFEEKATDLCLYKIEDVIGRISDVWEASNYYPYMVTPQELSFALACQDIGNGTIMADPKIQRDKIERMYRKWNYPNLTYEKDFTDEKDFVLRKIKVEKFEESIENMERFAISVDDGPFSKLKVSIGNARLYPMNFQKALTGKANRGYERYQQLSELLRAAIRECVDLLVLPENYLPWEWMPDVARLCANNQMGLITGIEHIVSPDKGGTDGLQRKVYNLTAVILPYRQEDYKYTYITYHQKVHFSPEEKRQIAGYRFVPSAGKYYHLFQWRDVWFSVYCCFELASIQGRSLFKSLADLTVAVEWNKDVEYFSSIVESLCRDLHCFCIQANSSDYGDSRVMSPSQTLKRDLIKTKGGINSAILVDEIDINALREFQRKEYELQREDNAFKPTPPNFDPNIPTYKQNGTIWKYMEEKLFERN
jgi:hypothetical protein